MPLLKEGMHAKKRTIVAKKDINVKEEEKENVGKVYLRTGLTKLGRKSSSEKKRVNGLARSERLMQLKGEENTDKKKTKANTEKKKTATLDCKMSKTIEVKLVVKEDEMPIRKINGIRQNMLKQSGNMLVERNPSWAATSTMELAMEGRKDVRVDILSSSVEISNGEKKPDAFVEFFRSVEGDAYVQNTTSFGCNRSQSSLDTKDQGPPGYSPESQSSYVHLECDILIYCRQPYSPMTPYKMDKFDLAKKVVLAPLTRSRSYGNVSQSHAQLYYSERATPGGLLMGEATCIFDTAQGYPETLGIWTKEQVELWKPIVKVVHDKGAFFFGRVSNTGYQPKGQDPIYPTDKVLGPKTGCSSTRRLLMEEIPGVVNETARNAMESDALIYCGRQSSTMARIPLMTHYRIDKFDLAHRVVLDPLTRKRSYGNVSQPHPQIYYSKRATPAEATGISYTAQGYRETQAIWTKEQVELWKPILKGGHDKGSFLFCQILHVGRVSNTSYQPNGQDLISPTHKALGPETWSSPPIRLLIEEIPGVINDFRMAAQDAIDAGFDCVEINGGNGCIIFPFMKDQINHKTGKSRGSLEKRCRFTLEVVVAVVNKIGRIRLFSYGDFMDSGDPDPDALRLHMAQAFNKYDILYLHTFKEVETSYNLLPMRKAFKGAFIAAWGY